MSCNWTFAIRYVTLMFWGFWGADVHAQFDPPPYPASPVIGTTEIELGDLDHDGHLDLVVSNGIYGGVSIHFGDGTGQFTEDFGGRIPGSKGYGLALGDVNDDGYLDIAYTDEIESKLVVRLNNQAGQFPTENHKQLGLPGANGVELADVNGDGHLDVVVGNYSPFFPEIWTHLGDGTGHFGPSLISAGTGFRPALFALADFNGDTLLDALVINFDAARLVILAGDGSGRFVTDISTNFVGIYPGYPVAMDLDDDGDQDFVVPAANYPDSPSGELRIFHNTGPAPGYQSFTSFAMAIPGSPVQCRVIDLNGDVYPDLAMADFGGRVTILENQGGATFTVVQTLETSVGPVEVGRIAVGDINEDARPDIAVSSSQFTVSSIFRLGGEVNLPPLADAGLDQELVARLSGTALVILDGTGSSDPNNDDLTYLWAGPFPEGGGTVSGANPVVTLPVGTHEVTLTVQDGEFSIQDTVFVVVLAAVHTLIADSDCYIRQGQPNQNQGAEATLQVRSSGRNRSLVAFDHGSINHAIGARDLVSAKLRLFVEVNADNWGNGREVAAHRMSLPWTELGATWNCPNDLNTANQKPDGPEWEMQNSALWPFFATPSAVHIHTNGLAGWVEFDVTADVQAYLDGLVPLHGWIVKKVQEGQNGRVEYSSREGSRPPELVLTIG